MNASLQVDRRPISIGFSLIELLMVLGIVSVLAAIAAPRYANSVSHFRCAATAKRIIADLAFARRHARQTSSSQAVNFDISNNFIRLPGLEDLDDTSRTYTVYLSEEPYRAELSFVNLGGDASVIFDGYGISDGGGSIIIQVGDCQKVIVLDGETGIASLQ